MTTRKRNSSSSQDDDEYRKKRERNNLAVKKCRIKSNEQAKQTKNQTEDLKTKNKILKGKIEEKDVHIKSVVELILQKDSSPEVKANIKKMMKPIKEYSRSTS